MNILYISYDGLTDPLGQSQVIPYLIGLSKRGHKISIISCEKKDRFELQRELIKDILDKSGIGWIPVPYSSLPSVLSKQINLFKINQKANQFCENTKPDIVHCRSYMAALIGLKLKRKFKIKFVFDMRGFWADERIDGKIWDLKNKLHKRIYSYFKRKEIEFLNSADYTISLTESAKEEILSWKQFKNNKIPIEVIPCCVDLNFFSVEKVNSSEQKKLKEKWNILPDEITISYLGSVGTWYMLNEMLDFFKCLIERKPNSRFLFITHDNPNTIIDTAISKGISADRIIIKAAERKEVPLYLSLSDIALYFIKPLFSKKASSPTKTGEIMALGIPIITNTGIGDSDRIITNSNAGVLINDFTNLEYSKIIDQIDVILALKKSTIIAAAHQYFSLDRGVEQYDKIYKSLAK